MEILESYYFDEVENCFRMFKGFFVKIVWIFMFLVIVLFYLIILDC